MKKKIFFYILIIFHLCTKQVNSLENKIILKVNNKIVTAFDITQETKYLLSLNPKLKTISKDELKVLATK